MPAPNNVQEVVERSIYEVIRLELVSRGYLPDITTYPNTTQGSSNYQTAKAAIANAQGFAAEVFGHGSALSKGPKSTPRIAIIPRRVMPGDIGRSINGVFQVDPSNPDKTIKIIPPYESSNLHIDVNLASSSAAQDRILHQVIAKVLGVKGFIPRYDDPAQFIFTRQFNFYDLPQDQDGIEEKSYSFEVPDLYLYEGETISDIPLIKSITVDTTVLELESILTEQGTIIGPFEDDGALYMDLSGISFIN